MAAEQLYDSLPREMRQSIADLPELLPRLQGDAQLMRERYDELQSALADAPDATSGQYADVREMRDTVQAKLGDAVTALETIRLNLLRLHAGSATVEGLTTHLGMAAEVSAEIARLVAAHDEAERVLKVTSPSPGPLFSVARPSGSH
jgi:serine/threonine-protein kinase